MRIWKITIITEDEQRDNYFVDEEVAVMNMASELEMWEDAGYEIKTESYEGFGRVKIILKKDEKSIFIRKSWMGVNNDKPEDYPQFRERRKEYEKYLSK